jgi:hypothetical protein
MRTTPLVCLASAVWFLLPTAGVAQQRKPLKIEQIQVGFGATKLLSEYKDGFWTPVYVDLKAWEEGPIPKGGELIVESVDNDEVRSRYTVPLPAMDVNEMLTVQAYTKPGHRDITVTAQLNGRVIATLQEDFNALDPSHRLYVTLGSRQPNLRRAMNPPKKNAPTNLVQDQGDEEGPEDYDKDGPHQVVSVDDLRQLPNRWFGYDTVDVLFLTTGNREGFLLPFNNEQDGRKEAIAEWVRRGGRLVVSVGANQDVVGKLNAIQNVLPVAITGNVQVPELLATANWAGVRNKAIKNPRQPGGQTPPVDLAKLDSKPGRELEILAFEQQGAEKVPTVIRGPYGLGAVTVVAFDLDRSPFKGWQGTREFWKTLTTRTAPPYQPTQSPQQRGWGPDVSDLASQLETNLEDFEDVPVISFGWVALFILIYILIVGPLDYFFLKKVVKRLELTWITFPTVVITISVVAYFTAYWLKGNDQKLNKVDLVDIDLHTQQVYGNTWFTIFSPRIQHYTIGLEPAAPDWASSPGLGRPPASTLLTWLGRPDPGWGGGGRGQSQGLFRRAYDYAPEGTGLTGVPIQVWSTKSFSGTWQSVLDPAKPTISADLRKQAEGDKLLGSITSRLPVKLDDVVLHYGGKWYALETLLPNVPRRVEGVVGGAGMDLTSWLASMPQGYFKPTKNPNRQNPMYSNTQPNLATLAVIKHLLFYKESSGNMRDNALRRLDQSWRLPLKDEVILFGRVARQEGPAEDISTEPSSATRLWLGALPAPGAARPPLNGTLAQESFVRVFIPVKTGG